MPERIQRKRERGWRMPAGAVYVGRPTKWGNPWPVIPGIRSRETAVRMFREQWEGAEHIWPRNTVDELRGKDLVCWCPLGEPCHADVLLEWANGRNP